MSRTTRTPTDHRTLYVVHVIRVAGLADSDAIAERSGLAHESVADILDRLAGAELVTRREGRMPGWRLTDDGKDRHRELLQAHMTDTKRHLAAERLHTAFTPLNIGFKTVCTDWQLHNGAPNTHDDPAYDRATTARLHEIHAKLAKPLSTTAKTIVPFRTYAPRFAAAIGRLDAGDPDAFTRPLSDSYHDIWMELHQDLILRLNLKRGDDDA